MFNNLMKMFKPRTEQEKIEEYLADSYSIEDLESRLKCIERREAPWQLQARTFSHV